MKMLRNKLHVYGDERLEVPSHLHFGKDLLDRMVEYGDHPALINADDGETMTFGQLAQKTVDIALSLTRIGVGKGDVVSICSEKRMEVIPTVLGAFCAGGVFSPIEITYGAVPVEHRIKIAKPKVMFMSTKAYELYKPSFDSVGCIETYVVYGDENQDGCVLFKEFVTETADVADFVPTPVDGWKDITLLLFSSGTTGLPKGVPMTHLGTLMNTDSCTIESFKYSSILITREWYFPIGIFITISCLKRGTTCVFTLDDGEQDFLRAIDKYKVKILQAVPSLVNQLTKSVSLGQYDVASVEVILAGSTPLAKEHIDAIKERFSSLHDVFQIYGMSEAGGVCNNLYAPLPKDGSVGRPSHGFIIKVVDIATREALEPNQRGEICVKSPSLMPGYTGVDNTDHLDSEGFYKTGDVGYYDDDRYFYVVNRIKELIKYKDISIAPAEVEAVLEREPRVRAAGVAARGSRVAALVTLQPHARATPRELQDYLQSVITVLRLEGGVHIVDALPHGGGGKLDRRALQDMLNNILDGETATHA